MAKVLHGDANGNQLNASENKTQIYGLKGNDTLISDNKSDVLLVGGSGDDSLIMLGGNGSLSGGDGSDVFELNYSADKKLSAVIEDLDPSEDKILVKFDGSTAPQLTSSVSGNDVVWKDGDGFFNLTLKSVRDNDYFDGTASLEAWKVLELTNAEREARNLSPLTMSQGLTEGAEIRVQEITEQGNLELVIGHRRPNGSDWYTVLEDKYNYPGENLDGGARTPVDVMYDWMNSESHSVNVVNPDYTKLGVGYLYNDQDRSDHRWYWTQMFADSLKSVDSLSATNLLTADIAKDTVSKFIQLTDNTIENNDYAVTIAGTAQADSITNTGLNVSISGNAGDDTITNNGSFTTINAGIGDDSIRLGASTKENLIQYKSGDGSDTISGLHSTDTVSISGDEYTPAIIDDNIVVAVGADSITLEDAANSGVQVIGSKSKLLILTDDNDMLESSLDAATILAKGGDDYVENHGANSYVDAGSGNDTIINLLGANVTMDGGNDDDFIYNFADTVTIYGGEGSDHIDNTGSNTDIYAGFGNDLIRIEGSNVLVFGEEYADTVINSSLSSFVTIDTGAGKDSVNNHGSFVSILSGYDDDYIENWNSNVSIEAGYGDDTLINADGSFVTLDAGSGYDSIANLSSDVTIIGGKGNDTITLNPTTAKNNLIQYTSGDGGDLVIGFNETSTLRIGDGTGTYFSQQNGDHIIVSVGSGFVLLGNAAKLPNGPIIEGVSNELPSAPIIEGVLNELLSSPLIEGVLNENPDTVTPVNKYIILNEGNDSSNPYRNSIEGATINAEDGNNYFISNYGDEVSISGANGNDSIGNKATRVIIEANAGKDYISNQGSKSAIDGGADEDYIENIGADGVILAGEGDDQIANWGTNMTIGGEGGNDSIYNEGKDSYIYGFEGDDTINNRSNNVTIYGGVGDDFIINANDNVIIFSNIGDDIISLSSDAENNLIQYTPGDGVDYVVGFDSNDTLDVLGEFATQISSDGQHVLVATNAGGVILQDAATLDTINIVSMIDITSPVDITNTENETIITGTAYGDTISNWNSSEISILSGVGNDSINNSSSNSVTLDTGDGNDSISNWNSSEISIDSGDGNDSISNWNSSEISIDSGDGDDSISNWDSWNVSIDSGAGNDSITNNSDNVTIIAGTGNDRISLSSGLENNLIQYNVGDGNDTIWGLSENSSLQIGDGTDTYSTVVSGDDIIINVGEGSIRLIDARNKPAHIILGESASSGGTSGDGGGGSSASGDGSSSGNGGSGGNSGRGGSSSGSSNAGASTDVSNGINTSGSTGTSSGNSSGSPTASEGSDSSSIDISNFSFSGNGRVSHSEETPAATFPTATPATTNSAGQYVYSGGNQVISNYQSWQKIIFSDYTESLYDGAGNLLIGSSTGALAIENAVDKIVDVSDASGKAIVKAYLSGEAGIVDGRGLEGYEIIHGSLGEDLIYAGDYGSQLWGNADNAVDSLVGGAGSDFFVGGMNQGADLFFNVSSADAINLNDATLENIVATYENEDKIAIAFDNGNIIGVQSSEALSGAFVLADGSVYRFNHINRTWQNE